MPRAAEGRQLDAMPGRKIDTRRNDAAFIIAFLAHDIERRGGAEVDYDESALVTVVRRHSVGETIGADAVGAIIVDRKSRRDIRGTDNQRFAMQIAPTQIPKIEERVRHDGGDDGLIEIAEVQAFEFQKLRQPNAILVGGAACRGCGAPLRANGVALADREDDVGISGVDGEQHGYGVRKNTSPAVMRVNSPSGLRRSKAP